MRVELGLVLFLGHHLVGPGAGLADAASYDVRLLLLDLLDPGLLPLAGLLGVLGELMGLLRRLQRLLLRLLGPVGGLARPFEPRLDGVRSGQRVAHRRPA